MHGFFSSSYYWSELINFILSYSKAYIFLKKTEKTTFYHLNNQYSEFFLQLLSFSFFIKIGFDCYLFVIEYKFISMKNKDYAIQFELYVVLYHILFTKE
jgi:hypothetical protein